MNEGIFRDDRLTIDYAFRIFVETYTINTP